MNKMTIERCTCPKAKQQFEDGLKGPILRHVRESVDPNCSVHGACSESHSVDSKGACTSCSYTVRDGGGRSHRKLLSEASLAQLIAEYDRLQEVIDANDGRLSTGSSAQLDLEMEELDDIAAELRRLLGIERFVKPLIQEEMRQYRVKRKRSAFIRVLLRIGFVSVTHDGDIHLPLHVAAAHTWRYLFWHEPWFGVFRNLPGVIKWLQGRWLPRRWGVRFIGLEFGDRGSSIAEQDERRASLFRQDKVGRVR